MEMRGGRPGLRDDGASPRPETASPAIGRRKSGMVCFGVGRGGVIPCGSEISLPSIEVWRCWGDQGVWPLPITSGRETDAMQINSWVWSRSVHVGAGAVIHKVRDRVPGKKSGRRSNGRKNGFVLVHSMRAQAIMGRHGQKGMVAL